VSQNEILYGEIYSELRSRHIAKAAKEENYNDYHF
jgi:hypothetical protein